MIRSLASLLLTFGLAVPLVAQTTASCAIPPDENVALGTPVPEDSYIAPRDYQTVLQTFFNAGGALVDIANHLQLDRPEIWSDWRSTTVEQDVTGDGQLDLVVDLLTFFGGEGYEGSTFAFVCDQGVYTSYLIGSYGGWSGVNWDSDEGEGISRENGLVSIQDMNDNGLPEFLIGGTGITDMKGRFMRTYQLYEWNGAGFAALIPVPPDDGFGRLASRAVNYGGVSAVRDLDGDGTLELILTDRITYWANDFSAWSILDRIDEMIWSWNGDQFELICTRSGADPAFRIQALEDGGLFMACGDYAAALAAYERVLNDESLLEWTEAMNYCSGCRGDSDGQLGVFEDMLEDGSIPRDAGFPSHSTVEGYVHFRQVVIYAALQDATAMHAAYQTLDALATPFSPAQPYFVLAQAFHDALANGLSPAEACEEAEEVAAEYGYSSPLIHYASYGMGYNGHEDLCPL